MIASGVAVLVMSLSTLDALLETTRAYYERYRFAEVFASLERAPAASRGSHRGHRRRAARWRPVWCATRRSTCAGFAEPVMGQFVSLPARGEPLLNRLVLREGRVVAPGVSDEVVLNEPFAQAHGLRPGDELAAMLNGNRRDLRIVGIALSPEFIYSLGPGALMPDDRRFGVLWMNRDTLAAAFDLKESFNSVTLELARGVEPDPVIQQLDRVLERYGGVGAIARADQLSNWFVMNEIEQLATIARVLPTIFLLVSAFLTNMVLGRLIATERPHIGLLKAFGYSDGEVALHYAKLVLCIAAVGAALGFVLGSWFGRINTVQYAEVFRFPLLVYHPSASAFVIAASLSAVAALSGAATVVRRAAALPPAQAMLPPAPPVFRRGRLASSRAGLWLDQPTRIILRNIVRWPHRSALTVLGVAASVGLLVMSLQWRDCIDYLAQSYFFDAQRQHMMIGLARAQSSTVVRDVEHMRGVLAVEPMRIVRADFANGPRRHRGSLSGIAGQANLQPIFDDVRGRVIEPARDGPGAEHGARQQTWGGGGRYRLDKGFRRAAPRGATARRGSGRDLHSHAGVHPP